jgi:hypothetical protein
MTLIGKSGLNAMSTCLSAFGAKRTCGGKKQRGKLAATSMKRPSRGLRSAPLQVSQLIPIAELTSQGINRYEVVQL